MQVVDSPNSFVGRERDLDTLAGLVASGERLVTVTGPGGIGKTRIVQRLASTRESASHDLSSRVFAFCDLTEAQDAGDICAAVGRALGVALGMSRTRIDASRQIGDALAGRGPLVVVLDNFEQIVEHAAATLGAWIDRAPAAQFVVTSRERLRLTGEYVFELAPLSLPHHGAPADESDAVRLLLSRVQRTRRTFDATPETIVALAEIAERLDGIPLAIELAAARLGTISATELLQRMGDRFALLGHGPRNVQARQSTLRGSIDWSWNLLEPFEQEALAQCSMFRGGFEIGDAERVIDLSRHTTAPPLFDVLQALREKSLVNVSHAEAASEPQRLALLQTIREYALDKLTRGGNAAAAALRHARHFVAHAEQLAARLESPDGNAALASLSRERENLLGVVDRAIAAQPPSKEITDLGLRALLALDELILTQGPMHSYMDRLDRLLALETSPAVDSILRARGLVQRGDLHRSAGNITACFSDFDEALAVAQREGNRALEGRVLRHRTIPLLYRSQAVEAWDSGTRALAIAREVGNRVEEVLTLWQLSWVAGERGATQQARAFLLDALDICHSTGNVRREGRIQAFLAMLLLDEDRVEDAFACAERALGIHRSTGDLRSESYVTWLLGLLEHSRGRWTESETHYEGARLLARQMGHARHEALCLGYRALLEFETGRLAAATDDLRQSVTDLRNLGDQRNAARLGASLAAAEASADHLDEAERTWKAAEHVLAESHDPFDGVVRLERAHILLARARRALRSGDRDGAVRERKAAEECLAQANAVEAPRDASEPARSLLAGSVDARIAYRWLKTVLRDQPAVDGWDVRSAPGAEGHDSSRPGLLVHSRGDWADLPSGKRVRFTKRPVARLLLMRLVRERVDAPGRCLKPDDLLAAGWPGEKILPHAAKNRLYVALTSLRNMGFRELMRANDEGYCLDPDVPVRIAEERA